MNERLYRFYSHFFGELRPNSEGECSVKCVFHNDNTESLSVNLRTGLWRCFTCASTDNLEGGDEYDFYKELKKREGLNLRFPQIKAECDAICGPRTEVDRQSRSELRVLSHQPVQHRYIDISKIEQWRMLLERTPRTKAFLLNQRGLTEETILKFKLGWDLERITIPIPDETGEYCNIRRYSSGEHGSRKMLSYTDENGEAGYGDAMLFPIYNLEYDDVIVFEGEMDTVLANQLGYHAVTATGGAGTWRDEWTEKFRGKNVAICYDIDRAGQNGARKVAMKLLGVADSVKLIRLPISDPPDGDFTNYIVDLGHTKEDFDRLLNQTSPFTGNECDGVAGACEAIVHLSQASNSEFNNKRVRFNVIVAGKDTSPYIVPKQVEIRCQQDGAQSNCAICSLSASGGVKLVEIQPDSMYIPQLIDCSNSNQRGIVRSVAGIPKTCGMFSMDLRTSQNVDQLLIIPELDFGSDDSKYVMRKAYHVYDDGQALVANRSYEMRGITVPDPRNQYAIHIIYNVSASQDDISNFDVTESKFNRLKRFQPEDDTVEAVTAKFEEIHKDFVYNVTHIYGRNDLLTAVDLTYHSVIGFSFMGKPVPKGMVETLILGDTRTGKTETVLGLMNHFKLGELITGENTSFAGLIGGMEQNGKRLLLRWGKFPLNDRRLVVVDEVSGMHPDIIGGMSGVRSSGVAEITKVGVQQKTQSRVRGIWMSNPRSGSSLSEYDYGTDAVMELIGRSEDVSRFDFVMTCASNEVDSAIINRIHEHGTVPHVYTFDLCKDLLLWAWSRRKNQVVFEEAATELALEYANEMGKTYSSKVPLVEAANQRIKLAKLAVAVAVRMFSTTDGNTVVVKASHVQFAKNYLEEIYRKPSLGYYNMSQSIKRQYKQATDNKEKVMRFLEINPGACEFFLNNTSFNGKSLEDLLDLDRPAARKYLKFLNKCGMIVQNAGGYKKSPHFIEFLREWMNNRD